MVGMVWWEKEGSGARNLPCPTIPSVVSSDEDRLKKVSHTPQITGFDRRFEGIDQN